MVLVFKIVCLVVVFVCVDEIEVVVDFFEWWESFDLVCEFMLLMEFIGVILLGILRFF